MVAVAFAQSEVGRLPPSEVHHMAQVQAPHMLVEADHMHLGVQHCMDSG